MSFDLTAEQIMLRDTLRGMLAHLIDPNHLVSADRVEVERIGVDVDRSMCKLGIPSILVAENRGGLGLGLLTLVVASEELGYHAAPSSAIRGALVAWLLSEALDAERHQETLAALVDGTGRAGIAVERTKASDGTQSVLAVGNTGDCFLVDRVEHGLALLPAGAAKSVMSPEPMDLSRPIACINFDVAELIVVDVPPEIEARFRQAVIILLAADAYGAGKRSLDMAVEYVKERWQFDRPIGSFQAIKHQLVDQALQMIPAQFLPWRAAHAWETAPEEGARLAALAKAHTTEIAVNTARAMVEVHGGVGYTWEYPLHLFLKRAMFDRAAWGTPMKHRAEAARLAGW